MFTLNWLAVAATSCLKQARSPFQSHVVAGAERAKVVPAASRRCGAHGLGKVLPYLKSQVLKENRWGVLDCSTFKCLMLLSAAWALGF